MGDLKINTFCVSEWRTKHLLGTYESSTFPQNPKYPHNNSSRYLCNTHIPFTAIRDCFISMFSIRKLKGRKKEKSEFWYLSCHNWISAKPLPIVLDQWEAAGHSANEPGSGFQLAWQFLVETQSKLPSFLSLSSLVYRMVIMMYTEELFTLWRLNKLIFKISQNTSYQGVNKHYLKKKKLNLKIIA